MGMSHNSFAIDLSVTSGVVIGAVIQAYGFVVVVFDGNTWMLF